MKIKILTPSCLFKYFNVHSLIVCSLLFAGSALGKSYQMLPITLKTFTATLVNENDAALDWVTENESYNNYFIIERGQGDSVISWTVIDSVYSKAAGGNSSVTLSYSYLDENLLAGKYYYRLVLVDLSNNIGETTKKVTIEIPAFSFEYFYGNEEAYFDSKQEYKIFDLQGRLVSLGEDFRVLFSGLKRGLYLIQYNDKIEKIVVMYPRP